MVYCVAVYTGVEWEWVTRATTSYEQALDYIYEYFSNISDDGGRLLIGSSMSSLGHALSLMNQGQMTVQYITFGQLRSGGHLLPQPQETTRVELEYGASDHDDTYVPTAPTSVKMLSAWLKMMNRVRGGEWGGEKDGDLPALIE